MSSDDVSIKFIENVCLCKQGNGQSNFKQAVKDLSYLDLRDITKQDNVWYARAQKAKFNLQPWGKPLEN